MLIFSVFKALTGQEVTIELKNDLAIQGTLASVDQFLDLKLENIKVLDQYKFLPKKWVHYAALQRFLA
ncbi:hypothetical protein MJO28_007806 [Puccinia striiformis f. sp. tritici]|uniref:Sm domain-containing protein n=2 Tax=Puccinia striiformis TaxID=27350 RepID=A0A2S4UUM3_9BASI|nr:hypothetical protein Pst134EB_014864 [Puccinia striiformis f. sp. tritici]KAI7952122.1 hypothetical protein MJO28_007806 [Puccinia striiformis f. sp. tritici]KAI7956338.1 hypothetical protein MJO29_007737 [Puccinia striiformis f. sp. tritici]POW00993.1 hypothetical protein PSTT_12732 [Puccinia striiformis]